MELLFGLAIITSINLSCCPLYFEAISATLTKEEGDAVRLYALCVMLITPFIGTKLFLNNIILKMNCQYFF
jgi:hypothetical protein